MNMEQEIEFTNHYDNLAEVAEFYGFELQCGKTVEECGELLTEIGRTLTDKGSSVDKIAEEIADVYNMLDQLCYLLRIEDTVQDVAEQKMRRERKRIVAFEIEQALDGTEQEGESGEKH